MRFRRIALPTIAMYACFFSCARDHTLTVSPDLPHPGMVKIESADQRFTQGWNDAAASLDEKPGMRSGFSYDYWLDTVEVTQKAYADLLGLRPVADTSAFGVGDEYPVYYVSWFDAVLFCNARSKEQGLDTVYRYSQKNSVSGCVYDLTGLAYDFTKDGYRLPTESEWEFAARGGADALPFIDNSDTSLGNSSAWYAPNASGKAHPVATKRPNALGLYDLAGNVFEWTNDWKGTYNGENILNSLGAIQPGNASEKVIKGGAYKFSMTYLRPSHRSATYPTTLSAANEYVGFRCARGPVPAGQYIGAAKQSFVPLPVSIDISGSEMRSFTGTSDVKIVFVNVTGENRTLCFVDFGRAFPYVREFVDDRTVFFPGISPDGHYVAYCSGNVGMSGSSKVTIRSLDSLGSPMTVMAADSAYCPRWWVDRNTGEMFVVYSNSSTQNNTASWPATKTFMQKIIRGTPIGEPVEICSDGSFHDGLSADRRYLVSGYTRLLTRNLLSGEQRQLFVFPNNGKDAAGSTQTCNVSLSPDTGILTRCLFLDFGYDKASSITGDRYGIHQVLFVAALNDSIVNYLHCPSAEASWDNPSWSNQPDFAVVCGRNDADQSHAIYCIDLANRRWKPVLSGIEVQQPNCRIGMTASGQFKFSLDSLGAYDDPHFTYGQTLFSYMMHYFWRKCSDLDAVFIGNSQVQMGIDCSKLSGRNALNIAFPGCGLLGASTIIQKYVIPQAKRLRCIGVNVPFYRFSSPLGEDSPTWWSGSIGQGKGFVYDQNHGFWQDSLTDDFKKAISVQPYYQSLIDIDTFGFAPAACNGWGGPNPEKYAFPAWSTTDSTYLSNLASFLNLIVLASSHGIHIVAINFPESPAYKNTDYYNIAVASWETGRAVIAQLRDLETQYPYFHLYDAYQGGNHDYTDGDALNSNHLCASGAAKLTRRVSAFLDSILARQ